MLVNCLIPKAFAVDVDGTLTDLKLLLDLEAVSVIRQLEAKGIKTIITTGRNFSVTRALVGYLGTCGLMVAENGGVIGVPPKTRILLADPFRSRRGLEILKEELGEENIFQLDVAYRTVDIVLEPTFDLRSANDILARRGVKARLIYSGVAYHIIDSDVDKGKGLKEICRMAGIGLDRVVAVGDNYNDIEMLEVGGIWDCCRKLPGRIEEKSRFCLFQRVRKGIC